MNAAALMFHLVFTLIILIIAVWSSQCFHIFGVYFADEIYFYKHTWPYCLWVVFSAVFPSIFTNSIDVLEQTQIFSLPWYLVAGLIPICIPKLNKFSVAAPATIMAFALFLVRVLWTN